MSEELSMTAMEYVLGTLAADERAAFARQVERDPAARAAIAEWERRLSPLAAAAPAEAPDPDVWRAIERRLGPPEAEGNMAPLQRAVARWRLATVAASALAASLALYVAVKSPVDVERARQTAAIQPAPATPRVPDSGGVSTASASRQDENLVTTASGARDGEVSGGAGLRVARGPLTAQTYTSALTAPSAPAALIARLDAATRTLAVRRLAALPAETVLRLWLVAPGAAPRSLGVLTDTTASLTLPRDMALEGASIAASIEPAGRAPEPPAGPFAYEGKLVRD